MSHPLSVSPLGPRVYTRQGSPPGDRSYGPSAAGELAFKAIKQRVEYFDLQLVQACFGVALLIEERAVGLSGRVQNGKHPDI